MHLLLTIASLANRAICLLKSLAYRAHFLKSKKSLIPVISVGNIRWGGSEKTPLVMHIISYLRHQGRKPAMITRGYKGSWEKKGGVLSDGKEIFGDWKMAGDEPYMVAKRIPEAGIFVGKNRYKSCMKASKMDFDVAVLDDGFQHQRLHRDLDIVLHNSEKNTMLRESASALKRADILLLKKGTTLRSTTFHSTRFPDVSIFEYSVSVSGIHSPDKDSVIPAESFHSKRGIAFSGIANPDRFLEKLNEIGINPLQFIGFPDHYAYPVKSIEKIRNSFEDWKADFLITTEKDLVKVAQTSQLETIPLYYLKVDLAIDEAFYTEIKKCILP